MPRASTAFSPTAQGFQFRNRFEFILNYEFPLVGEVDLGTLIVGLCGGMCFAALDYYYSGRAVTSRTLVPPVNHELRKYLEKRQFDSLLPPRGILKVLTWMVRSDRSIGGFTSRGELRMLRRRIDRGDPAVLALIRADTRDDPTRNHQVVATAYNLNESTKQLRIDLYDPNHPRQSPNITLNVRNPSRGISIRQSTGEPLRGFFVIDYSRRPPPQV